MQVIIALEVNGKIVESNDDLAYCGLAIDQLSDLSFEKLTERQKIIYVELMNALPEGDFATGETDFFELKDVFALLLKSRL